MLFWILIANIQKSGEIYKKWGDYLLCQVCEVFFRAYAWVFFSFFPIVFHHKSGCFLIQKRLFFASKVPIFFLFIFFFENAPQKRRGKTSFLGEQKTAFLFCFDDF